MLLFLQKCINFGVSSTVCICISIFVYVRGSWNTSRNCLNCSWNKTQTRFCLTLNNFPKSRLFANINVFELFDLPKSRHYRNGNVCKENEKTQMIHTCCATRMSQYKHCNSAFSVSQSVGQWIRIQHKEHLWCQHTTGRGTDGSCSSAVQVRGR